MFSNENNILILIRTYFSVMKKKKSSKEMVSKNKIASNGHDFRKGNNIVLIEYVEFYYFNSSLIFFRKIK